MTKLPSILTLLLGLWIAGCAVESKDSPTETYQQKNFLFNSNFALWQRGTTFDVGYGKGAYGADRWYVKNDLGHNSNIRFSRVESNSNGSTYGARVEITAGPTDNEKTGFYFIQTLDSATTLDLIDQPVSFSIKVKALGRTDRIAIQLHSSDTEKMVTKPLGREEFFLISPDHFTTVALNHIKVEGVPRGGVIGVQIRLLNRSDGAGNGYDRGNGIIVEQAILNPGIVASPFINRFASYDAEEMACRRFYEKSFKRDVAPPPPPANLLPLKALSSIFGILSKEPLINVRMHPKRIAPEEKNIHLYPKNGKAGVDVKPDSISETYFSVYPTEDAAAGFEWTVDTEIYE